HAPYPSQWCYWSFEIVAQAGAIESEGRLAATSLVARIARTAIGTRCLVSLPSSEQFLSRLVKHKFDHDGQRLVVSSVDCRLSWRWNVFGHWRGSSNGAGRWFVYARECDCQFNKHWPCDGGNC